MPIPHFCWPGAVDSLADFVAENRQGLWYSARLLGGYDGAAIVDDLAARLRDEEQRTPGTVRRARALLSLLMLENVHDPERVECGYFAVIDPSDPVTFEICALADGLNDALSGTKSHNTMRSAA